MTACLDNSLSGYAGSGEPATMRTVITSPASNRVVRKLSHALVLASGVMLVLVYMLRPLPALAHEQSGYGQQKVVYHINFDDPRAQLGALRNIQNHINAIGKEHLELRVVLHGNGLSLLMRANEDPKFEGSVVNLRDQGVEFNVCGNTLKARKLSYEDDLLDVDRKHVVPSGVAEIAHLQSQGFSYIKP